MGGAGGLKRTGKITLPSSFPSSNWPACHSFLSTFFDVQRRLAPRRSWSTTNVPTPCLHPCLSIPRAAPPGISPQIFSPAASPSTPSLFAFFLTYFALFHSTECFLSLSPRLVFCRRSAHTARYVLIYELFSQSGQQLLPKTRRETVRHYHHLV